MKLQSIQVLRGLAALLVVFYHMQALEVRSILQNGGSETGILGGMISNGYAGVDLFFVISGFIMVYVTWQVPRGNRSSLAFLFSRFTRIYPIWWFYAAIRTVYMLSIYGGASLDGNGEHPISRSEPLFSFIFKSFALLPQSEHPILGVGWTLVHEVYFYVIFAVIMLMPRKVWPAMFTLWGILVVAGSLSGLSEPIASTFIALATYPMTMEFILGGVVGIAVMSGWCWRPGMITLLAALGLCVALFMQGEVDAFMLGWGRVFWFGVPSALLIYGLATIEMERRLSWAVPTILGGAVSIAIFQLYGLTDDSAQSLKISATIVAIITGLIIICATFWMGWIIGMTKPKVLVSLDPIFSRIWRALARLGDWSYSLYLCHMIVLVGLIRSFEALARLFEGTALAAVFNVAGSGIFANFLFATSGAILTVIASRFSYEFLEKRIIRFFGKIRRRYFGGQTAAPKSTKSRAAIW